MNIEELVIEHAAWIHQKALRYEADRYEADDLASETIYKCLSQGSRFDTSRSFKPWALTIMENTYITRYNRRRCVLFTGIDDFDPHSDSDSADQLVSVRRILSVIRQCARQSCCIDSVILYAKGYSYDEISVMEGIPIGTVKSRVAAGRKMIRLALG